MSETKEFRVFYSWQSDLPSKANLNAIRKALKDACKKLSKNHPDTSFIADEATRDTAGSPNIAQTILEKIQKTFQIILLASAWFLHEFHITKHRFYQIS